MTHTIMMLRPHHFGYNAQTAENNAFQSKDTTEDKDIIRQKAREEFDHFVDILRTNGVEVIVIEDADDDLIRPDAVFPNNWISFHDDGAIIIYPMYAPSRRIERRADILHTMQEHFQVNKFISFEQYEKEGRFLEGTGSMILDRENKIAYACLSPRTEEGLLDTFCEIMGYQKMVFYALDEQGQEIYHTNVMMALGETFVVIGLASVRNETEQQALIDHFQATNKEIINLSLEQINSFAGNMLQVKNKEGKTFLVMSSQAYASLRPQQIEQIQQHTTILHAPIPTIEKYGGGSVRCMMAEVFLKRK